MRSSSPDEGAVRRDLSVRAGESVERHVERALEGVRQRSTTRLSSEPALEGGDRPLSVPFVSSAAAVARDDVEHVHERGAAAIRRGIDEGAR